MAVWLEELLPADAVGAEMRGAGDAALLFPEEAACLGRSVPKRIAEFAAGRLCARRALEALGIEGFPIRAAADRQPIWPTGVVGSITHTRGLCLAAVAADSRLSAIGLDSEVIGHVGRDLWDTLCVPAELSWLDTLPPDQRGAAAALVFTAKEAVYKCQYPVTGEWLDFKDLHVRTTGWNDASGAFAALPTRALRITAQVPAPLIGRYRRHEGFMTAAIALPVVKTQ